MSGSGSLSVPWHLLPRTSLAQLSMEVSSDNGETFPKSWGLGVGSRLQNSHPLLSLFSLTASKRAWRWLSQLQGQQEPLHRKWGRVGGTQSIGLQALLYPLRQF